MEPPTKRVKTRASKSSGPERKPHTTRKKKPTRSSLDYASPRDEKDYRPAYAQDCLPKKPKKPKKDIIIPRHDKTNENRRDPFDVLDDDAVSLIIDQLSARETEILRRVSTLWKASSEAHCGRNALRKHFPLAAAKVEGYGSRAEENLRFRRHLHYHESLAIGNATRAVLCHGALDWHLEHDTLVWSNKKGDLSIRTLRSCGDSLPITSPATSMDFRSFKIPFDSMNSAQLTEDGSMVVWLEGDGICDRSSIQLNGQRLMKITRQGAIVWEINFKSTQLISMPAVGKKALFFVERLPLAIVKVSLEDGSISYRTKLPDRYHQVLANESDKHLRLLSDEAFAVWRDMDNSAYVFSTDTGKLLQTYPRATRLPPVVGRQSSFIWDTNHEGMCSTSADVYDSWPETHRSFSQRVTLQEATPEVKFEVMRIPGRRAPHSEGRFSGDHCSTYFFFTHIVPANGNFDRQLFGQYEPTDPSTNVWVSTLQEFHCRRFDLFWMSEKTSPAQISLPSHSGALGERRLLEVELPWRIEENDHLGMANDYMVYHSSKEEILLLIDFWPNW